MRSDMAKVLVERPRVGGCGKERTRQNRRLTRQVCKNIPFEEDLDTPDFRGMKRVHTSKPNSFDDKKQLNENLNPLRRFLKSRIGRKWNDVYSEIMSGLNLNNAVQYHVWQHLINFGEVHTKTYMQNNEVMAAGFIGPESMKNSYGREEFYVDPRDGTLRQTKKIPRYRREKTINNDSYYDPKNPLTQYHQIDGIWYEYKCREATPDEKKQKSFGVFGVAYEKLKFVTKWIPVSDNKFVAQIAGKRLLTYRYFSYSFQWLWNTAHELFGGPYLPIEKRQISSKEIRRIEEAIRIRNSKFIKKIA